MAPEALIPVVVRPAGSPQTGGVPIVKLVLDISKKIFPTAATLILFVVPVVLGTVIVSEPSLAVFAINVVKFNPPSVDIEILTSVQFIGLPLVPFTDQVTV